MMTWPIVALIADAFLAGFFLGFFLGSAGVVLRVYQLAVAARLTPPTPFKPRVARATRGAEWN